MKLPPVNHGLNIGQCPDTNSEGRAPMASRVHAAHRALKLSKTKIKNPKAEVINGDRGREVF
jgi:hypothetical protein